jgi:diacylglycerol kinase family enzyme
MYLAPHARLDDGRLEILTIAAGPKLAFLRSLPKVFKGTHLEEPSVTLRSGRRVEITADRPFTVYADGDPVAELPVTITVDPGSLRLIAPPLPSATA